MMIELAQCRTHLHPMSVRSSPYRPNLIVSATAENFGLKGTGAVSVWDHKNQTIKDFSFPDAVFDAAFLNGRHDIIAACGDGFMYHVDTINGRSSRASAGHLKECVTVDVNESFVASGGWDGTVLVFNRQLRLVRKLDRQHNTSCHRVQFHPNHENIMMSSGGDGKIKLVDMRHPQSSCIGVEGHVDILSVDWNKYDQNVIASGSADGTIRLFDVRHLHKTAQFRAHKKAVKQLQFSPFSGQLLATASYDMSMAVWDWPSGVMVERGVEFGEFLTGIEWSVYDRNQLAVSCWDQSLRVFTAK